MIQSLPNLKYIFVSPLRRALQTAFHLFKNHPNRSNISIILDPDLRECLHWPCGIPSYFDSIINEFKEHFKDF